MTYLMINATKQVKLFRTLSVGGNTNSGVTVASQVRIFCLYCIALKMAMNKFLGFGAPYRSDSDYQIEILPLTCLQR